MSVIPLRIENDMEKQLGRIAHELRRPKSYIIREAIREYINDTIDYEIALSRMKDKNDEILTSREFKNKYLRGK
ncbi:MAG: ribbon-helix-helix protein, CopG family [Endomicrobiia bacterium]|nr:ribbon-helix-helix protein, CopG family [Endomicrobiia bacterium]